MPTPFKVTVSLPIPQPLLWRVRSSHTLAEFLVANGALARLDRTAAVKHKSSPTALSRRQVYVPANVFLPDAVKSLVDDSYIEVFDDQVWNDAVTPFRQRSVVRPAALSEVVATTLTLSIDPDPAAPAGEAGDGDDKVEGCLHTLAGETVVSIPFLGYYAEQAIVANMQQFYETYPRHISQFVRMLVDKYGDGTRASLPDAVDRMMADEKEDTVTAAQ